MTIEQVADFLGVPTAPAYGLMQYLKEIGHVEVTEAPSNGKRGRRPKLYELSGVAKVQLGVLRGKDVLPTSFTPETDFIGPLG